MALSVSSHLYSDTPGLKECFGGSKPDLCNFTAQEKSLELSKSFKEVGQWSVRVSPISPPQPLVTPHPGARGGGGTSVRVSTWCTACKGAGSGPEKHLLSEWVQGE